MTSHLNLDQLKPGELLALAAQLIQRVEMMDEQIAHHKSVNEIALLKRFRFAKRSEQLSPDQASLLDDLIDTDIAAIEAELEALQPAPIEATVRQQPKRAPLPPQFPRTLIHHEPDNSHCQCGCPLKRIGEEASEKLDYTPGVFTVERHIRGKWACEQCETLIHGSARCPQVANWPTSISRLISKPTIRKKMAIKPSLIQCEIDKPPKTACKCIEIAWRNGGISDKDGAQCCGH